MKSFKRKLLKITRKPLLRMLLIVMVLIAMADIATSLHIITSEINYATGAIRTRTAYGPFYTGPWKESPTWTSRFAAIHSISVLDQWNFIGERSSRHFGLQRQRVCGMSPVSCRLRGINLVEQGLSEAQQLRFVTDFSHASEEQRERMWEDLIKQIS